MVEINDEEFAEYDVLPSSEWGNKENKERFVTTNCIPNP